MENADEDYMSAFDDNYSEYLFETIKENITIVGNPYLLK